MKRLIIILLFLFVTQLSYSQTFTQTFVDRCTNEVSIVNATFVNGSATVAFYNKIRTFTYQQYINGELQSWLNETYLWWSNLSPCSQQTSQQQQAQQAADAAAAAAAAAAEAEAAANAASGATNNTSGSTNNSSDTTNNSSSNEGESSGSSGESSGSSGESSEGGSEEGSSEEGSGSEEGNEESGESSEESNEEASEDDSNEEDTNEDEETTSDEEKKEDEEDTNKKKKKKKKLNPIQLNADALGLQNPFGNYDTAISFGASQSSIYGDVSYSANAMFYSNLNQASLSLGRTKMYLNDKYKVSWIESIGIGYSNNYGAQSVSASFMRLKPMGKKGTIGMGLNYSTNFGKLIENTLISFGYNFLYANSIKVTDRLIYSPAFILAHTPITYATKVDSSLATNDVMFILSNSFTYRITKTFTINFGYTAIKSTNTDIPLINSFMIGSKLPF